MKVLKATTEQKELIESQTSGIHLIRFVKDVNDNWIVGKQVTTDPKFSHIYFSVLEEINFSPKKETIT